MIYLTGDLHNTIDFGKIMSFRDKKRERPLTKEDYLIILGDFGFIWHNNPKHAEYIKDEKLLDKISSWPWTTLFIDGNHENHARLNAFPEVEMFGNKAGKIRDSIYHLKRGRVYTIDGKKIFTFGGGLSIDQEHRIEGVSWWREELPTTLEMDAGLEELARHGNKVDYIWTHEAPKRYIPEILGKIDERLPESMKYKSPLAAFFDHLHDEIEFTQWACGHYHEEYQNGKFQCLYNSIVKL